jgi:hypothetical protein
MVNDANASGGPAAPRAAHGIYTWWQINTTALEPGSYSAYVRVALAAGATGPRSFGLAVYYNEAEIAAQTIAVTNKAYKWIRIRSFDLNQTGGTLRLSDWSAGGLNVDKLAIVKDVTVEAEAVAGGSVITDTAASGTKAVTSNFVGTYTWWLPPAADMRPGDYSVHASLASTDGAPHNFGGHVVLDDVAKSVANAAVSSTAYQWVKLNDFTFAGGAQVVRVSDYSAEKLKVDRLRLVRATPYDENATVQTLFAGGAATLGTREEVKFVGTPAGLPVLQDPARVSIVPVDANTVYAYFRQNISTTADQLFQTYVAISTDGGTTFNVVPNPVIKVDKTGLVSAYDPQVTKRPDGYYMVFEGYGLGCAFSSVAAYSPDGLNNWVVRNVPVCATGALGTNGSGSVPNYYVDVETGTQYLQWASVNDLATVTGRHQAALPNGPFQGQLRFNTPEEMAPYALPRAEPGTWDYMNTSAGGVTYEDGYYYMVYDGSTTWRCDGLWGFGIMRSATPGVLSSWVRSEKNPFMIAGKGDSCWLQYPTFARINGSTYLYHNEPLTNWNPTNNNRTIYRYKLIQK